ncbi:hypothetical protein [uncultured Methylobacterium sp.]|uniref:hypothetical protein n=1 Tax=uncultured Methylobacterium sp. TaxID=157278 RepID=UPI0035CAC668
MSKTLAGLALAAVLSLPAAAEASEWGAYNGTWAVDLVTESGLCRARYSYAVAIREGQVQLVSVIEAGTRMSGHVGTDGTVGLDVSNGGTRGAAAGRLQAQGGAGTWKVSSLCSGRWTARRTDARTAQAG